MDIIDKIEQQALSFDDLKRMLSRGGRDKDTKLMDYDELGKFEHLAQIFGSNRAVIILLQIEAPNAPRVGHWIAMLDQGDHFEHFDSYGLSADEELAITHESPHLTRLIQTAGMRVEDSTTRYQQIREHTNTCGRWCVARVLLQKLTMKHFKAVIQQSHSVPDVTIALMTMFL